ncbi:MAG: HAMP domain-containing protein [Rhizobacter sp.]|nr:HAMP domain-containing protein [Chlorobiales bacterium]
MIQVKPASPRPAETPPSAAKASLGIRTKVLLMMSTLVVTVVGLLLALNTYQDKRLLSEKADETGKLLVKTLSASVRDELLIGEILPIEESVRQLSNLKTKGIKEIYVSNREGEVVAHSNTALAGRKAASLSGNVMAVEERAGEHIVVRETKDNYEYTDSIFVGKESKFIGRSHLIMSKASIVAPIEEQQKFMLLISAATLVLALLLMMLFIRPIMKTLESLSDAVKKVRTGDLDIDVISSGNDELGELAFEFNEMVVTLKRQMNRESGDMAIGIDVKNKISDEQVFGLAQKQTATTILSTDPKNFNAITASHDIKTALQLTVDYNDLKAQIIEKHGGIVDRSFRGGLRAYFKGSAMADDAMEAAMEIQATLLRLNTAAAKDGQPVVVYGMGISSGIIVATEIKTKSGKTVFTPEVDKVLHKSSYLSALSAPYGVLITEEVAKKLKKKYAFGDAKDVGFNNQKGLVAYQIDAEETVAFAKLLHESGAEETLALPQRAGTSEPESEIRGERA